MHVCLTLPEYLLSSADEKIRFGLEKESFSNFLSEIILGRRVERILLMGSERFQHRVAIELAKKLGVPLLSLEEGYIRPGYVTAEWMGNNRSSPIRAMTDHQLLAEAKPKARPRGSQNRLTTLFWLSTFHYVFRAIGAGVFKRHLYHRERALVSEFFLWQRNWFRKLAHRGMNARVERHLITKCANRFFILPLQVYDDMQLVAAGRQWSNRHIAETALKSFARCAPEDHILVVKVHPFDRGHFSDRNRLLQLAASSGIADRFFIIDDGHLGPLTKASCGMLTINSTSGLLALQHGVKLGVAGEALYSRNSLCIEIKDERDIDQFWGRSKPVDQQLADGFRFALLNHSLLPGNFYSSADRQVAARAVVRRLVAEVPKNVIVDGRLGLSEQECTSRETGVLPRTGGATSGQLAKVKDW
ncbi:MAG: hypothetical protein AAFN76_00040 [Pseudomonadota bacterium]